MKISELIRVRDVALRDDEDESIPLRRAWVLTRVGKARKVLDVGCGTGALGATLIAANNEVHGIELNAEAALEASRRGLRVKVSDLEEGLPFETGAYDFVNMGGALEQVFDTRFVLEECARVLRPDGRLLLTVTNLNSLENRARVLAGGFPEGTGAYPEDHGGGRIRHFNVTKLRELLHTSGFRVVEERGIPWARTRGVWVDRPVSWLGRLLPGVCHRIFLVAEKARN
jgi:SAM-dependent methyltransferase